MMADDNTKALWQRVDSVAQTQQQMYQSLSERTAINENNVERLFKDHREIMLTQKNQSAKQEEFQNRVFEIVGDVKSTVDKSTGRQDTWNVVIVLAATIVPLIISGTAWLVWTIKMSGQ